MSDHIGLYDRWKGCEALGGGPPLYMLYTMVKFAFEIVYVVMCLVWPFLHMFKAKPVIITNHL